MKNPIAENWYADPESRVYGDTVYMYVAYHRRTIGDANIHHRKLCIDRLDIQNGRLQPVKMT